MKKILKGIILVVTLCMFFYAAYRAYDIFITKEKAKKSYEDLNKYVEVQTTEPSIDNRKPEILEEIEDTNKEVERYLEVDFKSLLDENQEFVGWLYLVNDHIINYPVVQHDDNSYYLNHLFNGTRNITGTLFLDYRNDKSFVDDNSIIYGHTMKNETMFHNLGEFKKQAYYEKHPYFYLELLDKEYRLDVFACYVTESISDAYVLNFNEKNGTVTDANGNKIASYKLDESIPTFETWYKTVMEKNLINTKIEVSEEDKIVTFSACDYSFNNARVVVHCKIIDTNS
jgi:sortase B